MAKIGLVRIDSRLIHGQVCTQWLYRTKSKKYILLMISLRKIHFSRSYSQWHVR